MHEFIAVLKDAKILTEDLGIFCYQLNKDIYFIPGQFITISIDNSKAIPLSMTNSPKDKRELQFLVKKVGEVTGKIFSQKIGDFAKIRGPFGKFILSDNEDVVLIAGGTGIAPFVSMLRYLSKEDLERKITLFYTVKFLERAAYFEELLSFSKTNKNIQIIVTFTQSAPKGWRGETSRVDMFMIKKYVDDWKERTYYLCGPRDMVNNLIQNIILAGIKKEKIKKDIW